MREDADRRRRDWRASVPRHRPGGGGHHPASGQPGAVRGDHPRARGAGRAGLGLPAGDHRGARAQGDGPPEDRSRRCSSSRCRSWPAGASWAGSGRTWWWASEATPPGRWCWPRGRAASPPPSRSRTRSRGSPTASSGASCARCSSPSSRRARRSRPGRRSWSGNPVRRKLMDNYLRSRPQVTDGRFRLLVVGGSLGARGLNTRMVEALPHLGDLRGRIEIVHQTGAADLERVKAGYAAAGVERGGGAVRRRHVRRLRPRLAGPLPRRARPPWPS